MSIRSPAGARRRPRRADSRIAVWTAALIAAIAITIAFSRSPSGPPVTAVPPSDAGTVDVAPLFAGPGTGPPTTALERTEVRDLPRTADAPSFEDYIERLVVLGLATSRHVADGDHPKAKVSDAEARAVFTELMAQIADAPGRALMAWTDLAARAPSQSPEGMIRRTVYRLCLATGLELRHSRFQRGDDRGPLDQLTAAVLTALPAAEDLPRDMGQGLLVDRPYLGAAHEQAVIGLVSLASTGGFPKPVAVALTLTLWRNLEREGARTGGDLASLALLWLDDANPAHRSAACIQLMTEPDGRFAEVVLDRLRTNRDPQLAGEIAMAVARDVEPRRAVSLVEELAKTGCDVSAAMVWLGHRDSEAMTHTYELRLADGVNPAFRGALISGLGFSATPTGIAAARLAFQSDPDLGVRTRAMFALTANAADALGEETLQVLLDDPVAGSDPATLGAVVLALENLERAGLFNAIDRVGRRLLASGHLARADRQSLERILTRALPRSSGPR